MLAKECHYAVVPLENSTNGSVVFTLDILRGIFHTTPASAAGQDRRQEDVATTVIHATEEVYVPINHCLISTAKSYADVKRLYTHPQAWGQVEIFTSAHFPADIEKIDANSTSAAVELAKNDPEGAAIAAAAAATVHGVPILKANISNNANNTTRFIVFSRIEGSDAALSYNPPAGDDNDNSAAGQERVTMASFTVPHNSPGSLALALLELGKAEVSLTSINSRPSGTRSWMYVFFIEFLGDPAKHANVKTALDNIQQYIEEFQILGSFARSKAYYTSIEK